MDVIQTHKHPTQLGARCPDCQAFLSFELVLGTAEKNPLFNAYCPIITCPKFARIQQVYHFSHEGQKPSAPAATDQAASAPNPNAEG
ncbi:MAG: hypothetical protein GF350_04080 [Chitinivibrionales bacterium]|nr:hypothetical protein [Chitinivibrionales bacterium]